jgi:serine/threonine protein kinase
MPDSLRVSLEAALGSQYSIQRLLGRGGMAAVYLATERSLERSVAIKVLAPEMSATVDSTERFRREARIAARLAHPNIVPLYAFGEVDGLWYYVMGHVRGGSLAERLSFEGTLPWEAVSRVVAEIADALDYAHRQGVIHRDIKPANVLLEDESGRAMLTDFGIARNVDTRDRLTITGLLVGTPHYMTPDQAMGAR